MVSLPLAFRLGPLGQTSTRAEAATLNAFTPRAAIRGIGVAEQLEPVAPGSARPQLTVIVSWTEDPGAWPA